MNPRTFKIIEEVSSQGIWSWLEIDNLSNSLYLEFQNLKLLEDMVIWGDDYNGNLAIRFGDNLSLTIFYNNVSDCKFLKFKEDELEDLFSSDIQIIDKLDYFYREFSKDICKLKFQDYEYLEVLSVNFKNKKVLIKSDSNDYDFSLIVECDDLAIVVGANLVHCFNDSESLNDDDIKRLSNKWILYYLDYWKKKGSSEEYAMDLLCEEFPFEL
ncbi:MAG: hypothetical protein MJ232_07340 [archaeon]|nr:hypothetical protein [archaeon]